MKSAVALKPFGMFPGKELGIALFVSALWHLVCIFSITIVSFPREVKFPSFSQISFVGSVLSEPDFEIRLSQLPFTRRPDEVIQPFLQRSGRLMSAPLTTPGFWTASGGSVGSVEETRLSEDLFLAQRPDPLFFPEHFELPQEKEAFVLEGPARQRILYYRPERPQLPRWVDLKKVKAQLRFKFWITPQGKTESIETLVSSGDPQVDLIGVRYLRRWRFNPRPEGREWGTVSFPLRFPPDLGRVP